MRSSHIHLKDQALSLRRSGISIVEIERSLGIPRSTLSGWFKSVVLTQEQKIRLNQKRFDALVYARKLASAWHRGKKEERISAAEDEAQRVFQLLDLQNNDILEMALAMLYLAEGSKVTDGICLASTDPNILIFFLYGLERVYKIPKNGVRCALHLRLDQNPQEMKVFWSLQLQIPQERITEVYFDKRTQGSPTRPNYFGVCTIRYGKIQVQRRMLFLARMVCDSARNIQGL